jgi:hypothetical protein
LLPAIAAGDVEKKHWRLGPLTSKQPWTTVTSSATACSSAVASSSSFVIIIIIIIIIIGKGDPIELTNQAACTFCHYDGSFSHGHP